MLSCDYQAGIISKGETASGICIFSQDKLDTPALSQTENLLASESC
jgi:hypothetical protein